LKKDKEQVKPRLKLTLETDIRRDMINTLLLSQMLYICYCKI